MVFWITARMKATKEQDDEKLMVIKLFASNYARDCIEEQDEEKNEKTLSITSQAFRLFLKNKSFVKGIIILDISKDEIILLLHESIVFFC